MILKLLKPIIKTRYLHVSCCQLATDALLEDFAHKLQFQKAKKKKNSDSDPKTSKEIFTYFDHPERKFALEHFPEKLLKKKTRNTDGGLYLATDSVASIIADILKKDLKPNKPIIEINPGPGLLTKHLINETENTLMLYEPNEAFYSELSDLIDTYPNRKIDAKPVDFTSLWRMAFIDKLDRGKRIDDTLLGICKSNYEDETNARLFAATGSLSFVKHLINSVIFQNSLMSYGRCELYLCLPPPLFLHLTCSKKAGYLLYRATSVLFQILFEYEFVCRINRKEILPWKSEVKHAPYQKMERFNSIDPSSMYLMRAVPRKDLYQFCMPENLTALWFFVKQHFISRKNRVIPTLERWIPGCGPRLIVNPRPVKAPELIYENHTQLPEFVEPCFKLSNEDFVTNVNIFTEFGDLRPTQVLTLFDQFSQWPEYKESSFNASLETTLMKLHTNPDDSVDGIDLPEEDDNETRIIDERKISR